MRRFTLPRLPIGFIRNSRTGAFLAQIGALLSQQNLCLFSGVLIHCQEGICRSATFVVAYLMQKRRMTLQEANETVARARPLMSINSGFQLQLQRVYRLLQKEVILF
jgi:protein-tyrosine phosphatase